MSFFDDVLDRIFPKKGAEKPELIHEVLKRSEAEQKAYSAWLLTEGSRELVRDVENAYHLKKSDLETRPEVHVFDTAYSNGLAITFTTEIGVDSFKHLFDLFKDQVIKLNYFLAQGDRRIREQGESIETIEKWYLKPKRIKKEGLSDQRYGNVIIEHVSIDQQPNYIKLVANIYQDRYYTKALPFEELIDELFTL